MNTANTDITEKKLFVDEVNDRIWTFRAAPSNNYDPLAEAKMAMDYATELNYSFGIARCKLNHGMGEFILRHNTAEAFKLLNEALSMFIEQNDKRWIANTQLTIAIIGTSSGRPEEALYPAIKGVSFFESKNNEEDPDAVMAYYVTGTVYKDLKKFDEAKKYYESGLKQKVGNTAWFARIYTSLSNILNSNGDYPAALDLANRSLELLQGDGNEIGISRALSDIGVIYRNLKQYPKALDCFFEALKLREKIGVKQFVLGNLLEIAEVYKLAIDTNQQLTYLKKAEILAKETGHEHRLAKVYRELAEALKIESNLHDSIGYYEKYILLSESLIERDKTIKIEALQNTLLQEKEKEIERLKNVELKEAYELISEKNKEITDSILYAQRIQKTLLASDELLAENLTDHFILFKPKDIVSGDFYWATNYRVKNESESAQTINYKPKTENLFYLAVCDSTGHGVPGAFMSLLNITFLNEAINQKHITEPGKIFDYVREKLISSVSQDGAQDGMDGTLICISKENNKVSIKYSSANNQAILVSKENLGFLNTDKMPVGKGEKNISFSTHEIFPKPGDVLYLFTDGYADQFGGPKGKKFRYRQLETLLQNIESHGLAEQRKILDEQFSEWKGSHEQVDDVLLAALRF